MLLCRTPGLYNSIAAYNYLLCKPLRVNKTLLPNLLAVQMDASYYRFQVLRQAQPALHVPSL